MSQSAHPAPHRDNINFALLTAALIGTPAVWSVRLVVNYAIDSYFCFPGDRRSNAIPSWAGRRSSASICWRSAWPRAVADLVGQLVPDPAQRRQRPVL